MSHVHIIKLVTTQDYRTHGISWEWSLAVLTPKVLGRVWESTN